MLVYWCTGMLVHCCSGTLPHCYTTTQSPAPPRTVLHCSALPATPFHTSSCSNQPPPNPQPAPSISRRRRTATSTALPNESPQSAQVVRNLGQHACCVPAPLAWEYFLSLQLAGLVLECVYAISYCAVYIVSTLFLHYPTPPHPGPTFSANQPGAPSA
ncbi:hypothetical protein C7974DRAFT_403619 [Boeremia exigua]|uniref:uncharacterized protein n=1 Tax=Boeremia exigua TaxID=749465 RepID=UPI001E8EE75A|nr:uncharacterized protein C7974DRAFT_403619 [Boeremia exigua]KAH6615286.1 hypothetical protein C7974DRAFT_403619 [Boeremia exigua]